MLLRRLIAGAVVFGLAVAAVPWLLQDSPAAAQTPFPQVTVGRTVVGKILPVDVRHLPSIPPKPLARPPLIQPRPGAPDVTVAPQKSSAPSVPAMPTPTVSFDGLSFNGFCGGVQCGAGWPPDNNGDVSPSYYVETVNTSVGIFDKSSGTQLAAFTYDSFWSAANSGTPCDSANQGDPTVVWDPTTGLWAIADFAFGLDSKGNPVAPYYECLALSPDATLLQPGWKLFAIETDQPLPGSTTPSFPDYPKMGAWPDGMYMTANMFSSTNVFQETRLWAFDIADAYTSGQMKLVMTDTNSSTYYSFLPSNYRGTPPPAGSPNYVVGENSAGATSVFDIFTYHVDYDTPANTTLTGPIAVSQTQYTQPGTTRTTDIIPQPGTTQKLDSLGDRTMWRAQYRNLGGQESLWVVHTVRTSTSSPTAIQWAQIGVTGGVIQTTPLQQQIWTNNGDTLYRWVPSLAVDGTGDMAVGFSVSNSTTEHPSIHYAGRLASDPPNDLPQGETSLIEGTGSQTGGIDRWGDYTAMTVDPVDDCTFWYVNEYYSTTGTNWDTRIGSFSFPQCQPLSTVTPTASVTGTVTGSTTATASTTPAASVTGSPTTTPTITGTVSASTTPTSSVSPSATATASTTPVASATSTASPTLTPTSAIIPRAYLPIVGNGGPLG